MAANRAATIFGCFLPAAGPKQYDSANSLILMGARPYDPTLGRFLAVDPIDGGSLNNYDYAGQDPINNYDLDGATPCWFGRCVWVAPAAYLHRAIHSDFAKQAAANYHGAGDVRDAYHHAMDITDPQQGIAQIAQHGDDMTGSIAKPRDVGPQIKGPSGVDPVPMHGGGGGDSPPDAAGVGHASAMAPLHRVRRRAVAW